MTSFRHRAILFVVPVLFFVLSGNAQAITGIWRGKVGNTRTELKLVRRGDSLTGTAYYYESKSNYRRYSVKGYFDDHAMEVIWWDEALVDDHGRSRFIGTGPMAPELSVAEFNCPDDGPLKLDGNISLRDDKNNKKKELHLVKTNEAPVFTDEWNFVLDNYAYGAANPAVIDSIDQIAFGPKLPPDPQMEEPPIPALARIDPSFNTPSRGTHVQAGAPAYNPEPMNQSPAEPEPETPEARRATTPSRQSTVYTPAPSGRPVAGDNGLITATPFPTGTNEDKYVRRKKVLQTVIPVKGDSVEFRFYDNAEIDGDSIAIFLNGAKIREHIRLTDQAYMFRIAVDQLQDDNEMVMVAENLGSIPPNTSLMVAQVGEKRYEAHLQSTEGSSALVRLVKSEAMLPEAPAKSPH